MNQFSRVACFVFVTLCVLTPCRFYAQQALQEIVRFNIPGAFPLLNEMGGDLDGDGRPDLVSVV